MVLPADPRPNRQPFERVNTTTAASDHQDQKPYACSMCPIRFANKSQVAPLERSHTDEKPYACSICPMRFAQKGDVPRHERTHTGEKPYACSMCPLWDKSALILRR